jgi:hypothetical protein
MSIIKITTAALALSIAAMPAKAVGGTSKRNAVIREAGGIRALDAMNPRRAAGRLNAASRRLGFGARDFDVAGIDNA